MLKRISLPIQLIVIIFLVFVGGQFLPYSLVQLLYTFSVVFKECLNFVLPFIIFAFVLSGILSFKKNAPAILALLMGLIFLSNALVALISYLVASVSLGVVAGTFDTQALLPLVEVQPLVEFHLPSLIRSDYALLFALFLGICGTFYRNRKLESFLHQFKNGIQHLINTFFIPLLPLYVLGFLIKVRYEGTFVTLFQNYTTTVVLIVAVQILYLLWFYLLAAGFSFVKAWRYIRNALPSYLTAFSTMSSAAAIPVTVTAAKKNIDNPELADMAVPILANVHLLGDSISTPLLALVTLLIFKGCIPAFASYITFVFYFCVSMFAVSGIPGGGILVMIPILKKYLDFNPEMIAVITTLYFLLDCFGTAANVMGDGALIIMVNKVLKRLKIIE